MLESDSSQEPSPELRQWADQTAPTSDCNSEAKIGVAFSNLDVYGTHTQSKYQQTFATYPVSLLQWITFNAPRDEFATPILTNINALVRDGEMVLVLGRPGSGCSTLLKTIAGSRAGLRAEAAQFRYGDVSDSMMHSQFQGDCIYCADIDEHFFDLNVEHTVEFAARAKPPSSTKNYDPASYGQQAAASMLSSFGLKKCATTMVGNDIKRGISGGEKKRVSLAETMLSCAPVQCWDSSTSGLDSATASRFIKNLRHVTRTQGNVAFAALYQLSQESYDLFDQVLLLHEGQQIYFGPTQEALPYFEALGFARPRSFTVPDFLTALTHPLEVDALVRDHSQVHPRSALQFATAWNTSLEKASLSFDITHYVEQRSTSATGVPRSRGSRILPLSSQLRICMQRGARRFQTNIGASISMAVGNTILAIIIGSVFYNLPDTAENLMRRSILLFYIMTVNAFLFSAEVAMLWENRPIIEKHRRFAFYRPSIEAISSMIVDLPTKILASLAFNIPVYFLSNLRRTPQAFFTFYLFAFVALLTLSMFFRMAGSLSRSIVQTIVPLGVYLCVCIVYSGFILPTSAMVSWLAWLRFIDPLYFALEAAMINEFRGRIFACQSFIPSGPSYQSFPASQSACAVAFARPGAREINGSEYILDVYGFHESHLWRNLAILIAMLLIFGAIHLLASELLRPPTPKGTVLEFRHKTTHPAHPDIEAAAAAPIASVLTPREKKPSISITSVSAPSISGAIEENPRTPILQWRDLGCVLASGKREKTLISGVSGYIRKGEVTALMGSTGAGKTTLLNVLAQRSAGAVSGQILHEGQVPSSSFQRLVGYVQQEDLHLHTATVREALVFSAALRRQDSAREVDDVVEETIGLLEMDAYADAVIGQLGEGLNLEQRRRLTIAVELVAQQSGVLFLDEPTSNLDSQTAWSICALLRRLASNGFAVLCTVHQPSGSLLGLFDNLLLLGKDGRQLYFGEIGEDASSMIEYFQRGTSRLCTPTDNPAEWMLQVTEALPQEEKGSWADIWHTSEQHRKLMDIITSAVPLAAQPPSSDREYSASFTKQYTLLVKRTFQEFWRSPSYLWSKFGLCCGIALFIALSLWLSPPTLQGLQSQLFSLFLVFTIGNSGMKQIIYVFSARRTLFEAREGPSKMYSRAAFVLASLAAEAPWQTLSALPVFLLWYFPTGIFRNAEGAERTERGALLFLLIWAFFVFMASFAVLVAAVVRQAALAANLAVVLYQLILLFCGVIAAPSILPRFWQWMYRVSPLSYLVSSMMSASIAHVDVACQLAETIRFHAPANTTCGAYLADYMSSHEGYLLDPGATAECRFCQWRSTDSFLATINVLPRHRWRDFGVFCAYVVVNVGAALVLYRIAGRSRAKR